MLDRKNICPCERHERDIAEMGHCICHLFVDKNYVPDVIEDPPVLPKRFTGIGTSDVTDKNFVNNGIPAIRDAFERSFGRAGGTPSQPSPPQARDPGGVRPQRR